MVVRPPALCAMVVVLRHGRVPRQRLYEELHGTASKRRLCFDVAVRGRAPVPELIDAQWAYVLPA